MKLQELQSLADELYPLWVEDRQSFIQCALPSESDWQFFQEIGIKSMLVRIDDKILPDFSDNEIFSDWDCGNWGYLLYALYQIAYDFAEYVSKRFLNVL